MSKANGKGDVRTDSSSSGSSLGNGTGGTAEGLLYPTGPAEIAKAVDAVTNLQYLCMRDDGWLRCSPDADTQQVYWKWKYTGGPWAGCYVMAVFPTYQVAEALDRLIWKIAQVERGILKPTRDTWFTDL